MAKRIAEERHDNHGPIRLMAQADGYRMVRRPGAAPFVMTDREWQALWLEPVQSPCGSFHCKGACQHIRDKGEPCTPAREKARPADLRAWAAAQEPPHA
jgi:hypothetical protein